MLYLRPISLQLVLALVVAGLGEARGDEHGAGDLLLAALDEGAGNELGRDGEHRGVDLAGHVLDALVGLVAHDLGGLGVDRVDLALVAAVDQVLHHRVADLAGLVGRADHGHRLRLHDAVHRRDDVGLGRAVARRLLVEVDDDAHVGGDRAVLGREHRVQVHLGDFREVADQLAHADDQVRERLAVDRVAAANALQHLRRLDAVEHGERVRLGRRREAEGDVLQHLDEHAAEAERDQLAEAAVGHRADDHLLAALEHLLHLDAVDLGVGLVLLGVGEDGVVGLDRLVGALHADDHAAGFGLVQDVRRDDLHHDRESHSRGELARGGGARRHALARHRDAVGIADLLAFRGGQGIAARGANARREAGVPWLCLCS